MNKIENKNKKEEIFKDDFNTQKIGKKEETNNTVQNEKVEKSQPASTKRNVTPKGKKKKLKNRGKSKGRGNSVNVQKNNSNDRSSWNNTNDVEGTENSKRGIVTTSSSYDTPSKDVGSGSSVPPNDQSVSIEVVPKNEQAVIGDNVSDANAYSNNILPVSSFDSEPVDLQISRSVTQKTKAVTEKVKRMKIISPKTVNLPYAFEVYDQIADTKKKFNLDILNNSIDGYNYALAPSIINIGICFNFSAYNPEIWRAFRKDIKQEGQTLISSPAKLKKLSFWEADVKEDEKQYKISKDSVKEFESFKTKTDGKAPFFDGHIPKNIEDPDGDLKYKRKEFPFSLNDAKNEKVPDHFKNDISTISTYKSFQNLISNLLNITENLPEFYHFRGFTRNFDEVIHVIANLINLRTFFQCYFYSIEQVQNRALKLVDKLGIVDGTFKHFYGSRITPAIQDVLNMLAGYLSEIPYNKRVFEEYKHFVNWGTISKLDYLHELNPIINVVAYFVGDTQDEVKTLKDAIPFRDNLASPAVSVPVMDLFQYTISKLKDFYKFSIGYLNTDNFNDTDKKNPNPVSFHGDNKKIDWKNLLSMSATRMTDFMYNLPRTFVRNKELTDTWEYFFRDGAQFFKLFKAKGIFDGTDFTIDILNAPILGKINDDNIEQFHSLTWFRGFRLGSNYSQYELITDDKLSESSFLPSWKLFPSDDWKNYDYLNLIGYFTISSELKEKNISKSNYFNTNKYYDPITNIKANLTSVNLIDCLVIPFVPFNDSIKGGWNYGTLMRGECYLFDPQIGVSEIKEGIGKDQIQFFPTSFEWSTLQNESTRMINIRSSTAVYANHPAYGYYSLQSLFPLLSVSKNRSGKVFSLFYMNDLNFLPDYWWKHSGEEYHGIGFREGIIWEVSSVQLFRNNVFKGLHPLARGRSYLDVPTRKQCRLGEGD